jgi:pilus assembly protein Flp/PilA
MMNGLTWLMLRFYQDRRGVTALEYGLIASLVALGCIVAVTAFGTKLSAEFTAISSKI